MRQIPAEFDDIRPYADHEVREQFEVLLHDRLFMRILRGFVPLPAAILRAFLRLTCIGVSSALGFQKRYMYRVMQILISRTTRRLTFDHSSTTHGRLHLYLQPSRHRP